MALKGQELNIKIKKGQGTAAVIAKATGCKISCSLSTEDATTKDETTSGGVMWDSPDMGTKSWSISVDKLFATTSGAATKTLLLTAGETYDIEFILGGCKFTGKAIYNQADVDAQNKQNASGTDSFTGAGALSYATVAAA